MLRLEANPLYWRVEDVTAQTGQCHVTSFLLPATEGWKDELKKWIMSASNILLLCHLILEKPLNYHSNNLKLRGNKKKRGQETSVLFILVSKIEYRFFLHCRGSVGGWVVTHSF